MPMDLEAALEDEAWPPGPPGLRFSEDFPDPKRNILEGAVEVVFMGINMAMNPARCVFRVPYGYSYRNPFVTSTAPPSTHSSQVVIVQNPQCSGSSWNIHQKKYIYIHYIFYSYIYIHMRNPEYILNIYYSKKTRVNPMEFGVHEPPNWNGAGNTRGSAFLPSADGSPGQVKPWWSGWKLGGSPILGHLHIVSVSYFF